MEDKNQKIREEVNKHGLFFQKFVGDLLKNVPSLKIIDEEYPILYQNGTTLDFLLNFNDQNQRKYLISVECKRGYQKQWIFFKSVLTDTKLFYAFKGNELETKKCNNQKIYTDAIEYSNGKANKNPIQEACTQILNGHIGFIIDELEERKKNISPKMIDFLSFPIIITNVELKTCTYDINKINSRTGNYEKELSLESENYIIYSFPFPPRKQPGVTHLKIGIDEYQEPQTRGYWHKEGVIIVNSNHVDKFFQDLSLNKI